MTRNITNAEINVYEHLSKKEKPTYEEVEWIEKLNYRFN
jgi:hypothetical protein